MKHLTGLDLHIIITNVGTTSGTRPHHRFAGHPPPKCPANYGNGRNVLNGIPKKLPGVTDTTNQSGFRKGYHYTWVTDRLLRNNLLASVWVVSNGR